MMELAPSCSFIFWNFINLGHESRRYLDPKQSSIIQLKQHYVIKGFIMMTRRPTARRIID